MRLSARLEDGGAQESLLLVAEKWLLLSLSVSGLSWKGEGHISQGPRELPEIQEYPQSKKPTKQIKNHEARDPVLV